MHVDTEKFYFHIDLNMKNGRKYSVEVTGLNKAGLATKHESHGVIVDTTPPVLRNVRKSDNIVFYRCSLLSLELFQMYLPILSIQCCELGQMTMINNDWTCTFDLSKNDWFSGLIQS